MARAWATVFGVLLVVALAGAQVRAAEGDFPFGAELTLDASPMRGSKRLPTLEIGQNGEARVELWCKGAMGQFSVAGNTVIFISGPLQDRSCAPDRAMADDALYGALAAATAWKRNGDILTFTGATSLRFQLNTN